MKLLVLIMCLCFMALFFTALSIPNEILFLSHASPDFPADTHQHYKSRIINHAKLAENSQDDTGILAKILEKIEENRSTFWRRKSKMNTYFKQMSSVIPELKISPEYLYHPYHSLSRSVRSLGDLSSSSSFIDLPPEDPNGYVSYMPHSGFSNQKQELENAMVVAKILNRTLIVPPLYLGHQPIHAWREFPLMQLSLRLVETFNFNRKSFIQENDFKFIQDYLSPNSENPLVPWSEFVDLDAVASRLGIKYVNVAEFVGLDLLHSPDDLMQVEDWHRYEYSLIDHLPGGDLSKLFDNSHSYLPFEQVSDWEDAALADQWFMVNMTLCKALYNDQMILQTTSGFYWVSGDKNSDFKSRNIHSTSTTLSNDSFLNNNKLDNTRVFKSCGLTSSPQNIKPIPWRKRPVIFNTGASKIAQIKLKKYGHIMNLKAFENSRKPVLLQFGSLFGQSRLQLFKDENALIREEISASLRINHPTLLSTMQSIADLISDNGKKDFLALHIRLNDGNFKARSRETIERMALKIRKLLNSGALTSDTPVYIATDVDFQKEENGLLKPIIALLTNLYSIHNFVEQISELEEMEKDRLSKLNSKTTGLNWQSEMSLLFDQIDQMLRKYGKQSPSIFRGPKDTIVKHHQMLTDYIKGVKRVASTRRNTGLSAFSELWIPLLEQLVCSRAKMVIGTAGSTFSDSIRRLHHGFWSERQTAAPPGEADFLLV